MTDLLGAIESPAPLRETIAEGAIILREAALRFEDGILHSFYEITARRHFATW
jgi:hypothetical protein